MSNEGQQSHISLFHALSTRVLCYQCSQLPHVVCNLPAVVPHSRNPHIPLCSEALFQYLILILVHINCSHLV